MKKDYIKLPKELQYSNRLKRNYSGLVVGSKLIRVYELTYYDYMEIPNFGGYFYSEN
jgi:hypothetical protein